MEFENISLKEGIKLSKDKKALYFDGCQRGRTVQRRAFRKMRSAVPMES